MSEISIDYDEIERLTSIDMVNEIRQDINLLMRIPNRIIAFHIDDIRSFTTVFINISRIIYIYRFNKYDSYISKSKVSTWDVKIIKEMMEGVE